VLSFVEDIKIIHATINTYGLVDSSDLNYLKEAVQLNLLPILKFLSDVFQRLDDSPYSNLDEKGKEKEKDSRFRFKKDKEAETV